MAKNPADDDDGEIEIEETSAFTAECHAQFFENTFRFHDIDVRSWTRASIADNTKTNLKVARLLGVAHVRCNNHKLNLDVERMARNNQQFCTTIENIHETMPAAKRKLKIAAQLRNLTDLSPVIHKKTLWSGIYRMLKLWLQIRPQLIEVSDDEDSIEDHVNRQQSFLHCEQTYAHQMKEINELTLFMQTHLLTLQECRAALDALISTVEKYRNTGDSIWFGCSFASVKTKPDSNDLVPNPEFESGVVKLQRGQALELTDREKVAVECLRRPAAAGALDQDGGNQHPTSAVNMRQKLQQMKEQQSGSLSTESDYVNCDFINGSTAEVERLWSISNYILTNNRKGMTPQLFEALVF